MIKIKWVNPNKVVELEAKIVIDDCDGAIIQVFKKDNITLNIGHIDKYGCFHRFFLGNSYAKNFGIQTDPNGYIVVK